MQASHAAIVFLPLLLAGTTASAAPFPTRDQNPLLAGFGLPTSMPARLRTTDKWSLNLDLNWGTTALMQNAGQDELIVDAETREARLGVQRSLTDDIVVRLQIPYRYTGGGSLDGFIDGWHDFFSLPEGARRELPQDQIRIAYTRDGTPLIDIDSSSIGLGDISGEFGYQLQSTASTAAAAWLSVKLPTGDAEKLTGSGAVDASLIMAGEHRFADRWSVFGQAGITRLGNGDRLSHQQRSIVWSGLAGIGWRVLRGLELKLQVDVHSAAFDDTGLDFLGDAMVFTMGGTLHLDSGWQVDIGVSEDMAVEASPDVVFVLGVSRRLQDL